MGGVLHFVGPVPRVTQPGSITPRLVQIRPQLDVDYHAVADGRDFLVVSGPGRARVSPGVGGDVAHFVGAHFPVRP